MMASTTTKDDIEIGAKEAAARLDLHPVTVNRMCREGRLKARKIGGRGPWRIRLSSVVDTSPPKPDDVDVKADAPKPDDTKG